MNVRKDLFLTGAARVCSAGATFLTAPLVISKLGIESYGLVALLTSIQAILPLADFGVLPVITSQFAKAEDGARRHEAAAIFKGLETICWTLTLGLAGIVYLGLHWVPAVSDPIVRLAIAAAVAGVFPTMLYNAGLPALGSFERVTAWVVVGAVMRLAGIWVTLEIWAHQRPLLVWLAVSGLLFSVWGRFLFWQASGFRPGSVSTDWARLRQLTSTGVMASLSQSSGILLVNLDRIVLSAWLPLSQYAIYSVGSSIGLVGAAVTFPVFQVIYPKMASLFAHDGIDEARSLYWGSIGVCFLGIGCLVGLFYAYSPEALRLILRVRQPDEQTIIVSRIMIAAGLLQGLRSLSSTVHIILERFRFLIALNGIMLILYFAALRHLAGSGLAALGGTTFLVHCLILLVLLSSAHHILAHRSPFRLEDAGCMPTSEVH